MKIEWTEEQFVRLKQTNGGRASDEAMLDIAETAVSIFLARASGQVKDDAAWLRRHVGGDPGSSDAAISRLSALAQEAESLRAKVAELERREREFLAAEAHYKSTVDRFRAEVERLEARTWIQCTMTSNDCLGGCRSLEEHDRYRHQALLSEVERLKVEAVGAQERSRTLLEAKNHWADRASAAESRLAAIRELALHPQSEDDVANIPERVRQILDGDATNHSAPLKSSPNSPGIPDGSSGRQEDVVGVCGSCGGSHPFRRFGDMWRCSNCGDGFTTFPCSPICPHADAATPGHLERVKAQSEAANVASGLSLYGKRVEWDAAFEQGVEAMRAALLREAKQACDQHGVDWLYQHLKHRFDGATA